MLDFTRTQETQIHNRRRREIFKLHPEIRELSGPHILTPIAIVLVVALQLTLAWGVRDLGIGWVLLTAYLVGAVLSHSLYTLIHECAHNLALRGSRANKAMGIVCDLALALPSATAFRTFHLLHHRHLGEEAMDPDITSPLESRMVGNSTWRKILWMSLFSISQACRPMKTPDIKVSPWWMAANLCAVFTVDALVLWAWGPAALAYLVASTIFALGLHPLGGRWIQEHYVTKPGQETYSYYGLGNLVAFNIGYHNEHHDFMTVSWIRLPTIRRIAAEHYAPLESYRSWTLLLLRFLFDRNMSPYSRIVHPDTRPRATDDLLAVQPS